MSKARSFWLALVGLTVLLGGSGFLIHLAKIAHERAQAELEALGDQCAATIRREKQAGADSHACRQYFKAVEASRPIT